jgi:uncharacterized protein YcnI
MATRDVTAFLPIRVRALRRALPAVLCAVTVFLLLAAQAGAHAVVRPGSSRPADLQVYTLTVPNEEEVATDEVALQVPAEIDFLLVDEAPGWKIKLERSGGRIAVVRWTGGSIDPDFYETLRFIARNPVRQGVLEWKINQRYTDGRTVRWIGQPGSETPASRTTVSETASPVDVVSVHGEKSATPSPAASIDGATNTTSDERDTLTLVLAIAGLGAGLVALLLILRSRRG